MLDFAIFLALIALLAYLAFKAPAGATFFRLMLLWTAAYFVYEEAVERSGHHVPVVRWLYILGLVVFGVTSAVRSETCAGAAYRSWFQGLLSRRR